jgi:hypothetical protein
MAAQASIALAIAAASFGIGHHFGRRKGRQEQLQALGLDPRAAADLESLTSIGMELFGSNREDLTNDEVPKEHADCAKQAQGINVSNASFEVGQNMA